MSRMHTAILFILILSISPVLADCNGNSTICNGLNDTLQCGAQPGCFWTPTNNALNGYNNLVFALTLIGLAGMFIFIGNTIKERKWIMKSAMYFAALLVMIMAINLSIQIAYTATINKIMTSTLVIAITASSAFLAFIIINYVVEIVRAVRDAKEAKKSELD